MEDANVPAVLRLAATSGLEGPLDVDNASYFLSTIELRVGREPGMTRWRKRLFVATSRITTDAANTSACTATAPSWAHASSTD